ncbi:polysaccharide chain length determinant protein, PEP-CTERM locus subfamily [Syntrophus gentianae]|uniref:Polysaccharide chain length determinant protein, PEP-CTERM locus subfamily n=1 Tax=Syntrophus gentianae TaxID=43775 RepID=A0A1H7X1Z7_9BACT|nr:Wzz/FepE/Etk N-terminal domain-containing protein [Syntrophus gentianae]SEM27916.1 polysaccharide chain length determinant protein, PEP-CTERM locus subfamily [Syntrophus gentianae]
MEENTLDFKALIRIMKRRKWDILLPVLGIFLIALIGAVIWPPTYRSSSTILIEEQEIPPEYVMSTVTGYAEQRLQTISQRIMTYNRLMEIINRFNLYADIRGKSSMETVIEKMRESIKFETISADVIDRTGRAKSATIAFTISFEGERPEVVQQVANVLASLYLEENLKSREEKSAGASKFIEDEGNQIQAKLAELDAKIAAFKSNNLNSLPELTQFNLQTLQRSDQEVDELNNQIRSLKEKESSLLTQLASVPQDLANPDKDRLKELRAKIVSLRTRYSEEYPDVVKTKQEIAELERRLSSARQQTAVGGQSDNPAYIALSAQLAGIRSDINAVNKQISDTRGRRDSYRNRIESGPRTEEQYKLLISERNNLQLKYDDLMKKGMEAKVAQGLEKTQMGERFTLIDPARLPEKPVRPNIPVVLLIGLILGTGAGVGTASLREFTDKSAHSPEDLELVTRLNVLAAIPEIETQEDLEKRKKKRKLMLIISGAAVVCGLLILHFLIMDIDILIARIMRRLAL